MRNKTAKTPRPRNTPVNRPTTPPPPANERVMVIGPTGKRRFDWRPKGN